MAKKEVKMPKQELEAEIIGLGPTVSTTVTPDGDKVSVGDKTWKVGKTAVHPGKKGRPRILLVVGQGEAVPVWGENPDAPTDVEVDTLAYNNLLQQLNNLSKGGGERKPSNVGVYIALGLVALVVIGATININGNVEDVNQKLFALQAAADAGNQTPERPDDSTQVGGDCLIGTQGCTTGG